MNSKATTRIKQLCSLGFESQILVPVLLPALRKAIPSYSSTFLWTTNDYRFVNFYDECSDTLNYLHLYHSEYLDKYDHEARPSLSEWLRNKSGVCTSEKFYYPHYIRTDFYNDILRPLRYHHELIVGIKHEQRPVGILFLHREAKQPNFSKAEVEYMQQLLPFITHGLSRETNYTDAHFSVQSRHHPQP